MTDAAIPDEYQRHLDRLAADRYVLVREIGRGGMATVYAARDEKLKRDVAIKILHRHLLRDDEHCARFRREAEAIARLDHRAIVEIFDLLEERGQFLAIVMEFIDGSSLDQMLDDRGPLLPELAAAMAVPVVDALAAAHEAGVIHRDLKPSNILIGPDGQPVVTDFGIAHIVDEVTLTDAGAILGSPAYMSPEAIDGQPAQATSDLFSLGAVLHLMVTGEPAFRGHTAPELMRNITEGRRRPADRIKPEVGREFSKTLDQLLALSPEDRPPSATAASRLLRQFLDASMGRHPPNLKQWFNDPERTTLKTRQKILKSLKIRAQNAATEADHRQAFDLLERHLSMAPDDEEALELLDHLHSHQLRHRLLKRSALLIGVAAVAFALWQAVGSKEADPPPSDSNLVESDSGLAEVEEETLPGAVETVERARLSSDAAARATTAAWQVLESIPLAVDAPRPVEAEEEPALITANAGDGDTDEPQRDELQRMDQPDGAYSEPAVIMVRFRLVPPSATLELEGHEYDAVRAARGVELSPGSYEVTARGPGIKTARKSIDIGPDAETEHQIVLNWKDGRIRLVTDRDALVWLDGASTPQSISGGTPEILTIPFGPADRSESRRQVEVRIADRDDLQRSRRHTVEVRPDRETPLAVTLSDD